LSFHRIGAAPGGRITPRPSGETPDLPTQLDRQVRDLPEYLIGTLWFCQGTAKRARVLELTLFPKFAAGTEGVEPSTASFGGSPARRCHSQEAIRLDG